jgi:hypothetical protein
VIKLEEKNNPMPQVPETPVITPVPTPIAEEPKVEAPKEESPVKLSWKKPIIKIVIIGVAAVVLFLLLGR